MLTKKRINAAIAHTGLEVVGNGDGYFYFVSLDKGEHRGRCVYVCRLSHQDLEKWVRDAEEAAASTIYEGVDMSLYGEIWPTALA